MTYLLSHIPLQGLIDIDPSPLFVFSLFPYLAFLFWANKTDLIPKTALLGFRLTLLFVFMTILFSVIAILFYNNELTNIDPLHGSAEAFLAISDGLILLGFFDLLKKHVNNS